MRVTFLIPGGHINTGSSHRLSILCNLLLSRCMVTLDPHRVVVHFTMYLFSPGRDCVSNGSKLYEQPERHSALRCRLCCLFDRHGNLS